MIACTSSCLHNRSAFLFCSAFLLGASSQLQATCSPEADTMWNLRSESAPCHWLPVELYSFLSMHIAPTLTFFALPHMVCSFRTLLWTLSYTLQQCNSMICCSKLGSQCAAPVPESQCYLSAGTAWQCKKENRCHQHYFHQNSTQWIENCKWVQPTSRSSSKKGTILCCR